MTISDLTVSGAVLGAYYLTLGILAIYGVHRLVLLGLYYRTRHRLHRRLPRLEDWPTVTVQLPLFNEQYVARRLIDAVCAMRYPRSRLQIQVLDDSTDHTSQIVSGCVTHYRSLGFDIEHVHRTVRSGFKAGALEAGLDTARGEFLAIFDADFVPGPEFLEETIPCFSDPDVGMVQARWDHINRDYSVLTRIQAIFLDGHFAIEHAARNGANRFFNFNGTAGVWRRQAIVEAGGWQHDTLTEDLDLSYRAQLAGWKFMFRPDTRAPAELPVDINAFKVQQFRWAKGSVQTARKLLGTILRAQIPIRVKIESFVHLTNNASYVLMVLLSLLVFPAMLLRRHMDPRFLLLIDLPLFLGATVSVILYYVVSQIAVNPDWRHDLRFMPSLMGLGIGLSVNNARAVLSGLFSQGGVFERTPKYGIEARSDRWRHKSYGARANVSVVIERLLAVYSIGCFVLAWKLEMWWSIPFLLLFVQGYIYMTLLSISPGQPVASGGTTAGARPGLRSTPERVRETITH